LLALILAGCVTPFEPSIEKYENLLVVDGAISNIPGSVYVKLSRTSPYNELITIDVDVAEVTLVDDLDNKTELKNITNGEFVIMDPNFAGEVGRSYKIVVETSDGVICESAFEELINPIPIDGVKYEFVDGPDDTKRGLEIQVDVENKDNRNAYFYWQYVETWEFEVPYISPYEPDSKICYKTTRPPVFIINSTSDLVENQLIDFPLYFIDNTSNRLYRKYSVLITQYTITEPTFIFYQNMKEINEDKGSLFDKSPVTLVGNMHCITNPDQIVLGNFQVSGADTKRIFINNIEVADKLAVPSEYEDCEIEYLAMFRDAYRLDSLIKEDWIIMDKYFNPSINDTMVFLTGSVKCYDCKHDGTNIKPEFWDTE
jgi:hypothetical protein